jgi:hypothetical protein
MQATGIPRVATDEFEAKVAKTPARVVIADDADVPLQFLRTIPASYEPDKAALAAALKAGAVLDGVRLVPGYRLAIK